MKHVLTKTTGAALMVAALTLAAAAGAAEEKDKKEDSKTITFEYELDAHYSNMALYASLTDKPIPEAGEIGEFALYRKLFLGSLVPRFVVLEASVFPLPALGVFLKKNAEGFYEDMELGSDFNFIEAITAGFEEPYALSLFVGNILRFKRKGEEFKEGNFGYSGYLVSFGDEHIKDNELVDDDWMEAEWKMKGDRSFSTHKLSWSFRIGAKLHGNDEIKDVYYVGLRRSRLGFEDTAGSIFDNAGFEYRFDMDKKDFSPIRHYFTVDKKWPWKEKKMGVSMVLGFIWEGADKYTGSLDDVDSENESDEWQIILRPNIHF